MPGKRLKLSEDLIDDVIAATIDAAPVVEPKAEAEPQPEQVSDETVANAYSDLLQDILRKQWDVINAADGMLATMESQEMPGFDKEGTGDILRKVIERETESIGMITKALGVVDPEQESAMDRGSDEAEAILGDSGSAQEPEIIPDGILTLSEE